MATIKERAVLEVINQERKQANQAGIDYRLALSQGNERHYKALRSISLAGIITQWTAIIAGLIGLFTIHAPTGVAGWFYLVLFILAIVLPQCFISSYVATFGYSPRGMWAALLIMSILNLLATIWLSRLAIIAFIFIIRAMFSMRDYNTWFRSVSMAVKLEVEHREKKNAKK